MTSYYYYTYIIDRYNHGYYRYHPVAIRTALHALKNIEAILKEVKSNRDITLVVTSDHGG